MSNVAVILPAYNEEKTLEQSVNRLYDFTKGEYDIIIADNNSTDSTANIAKELCNENIFYNLVEEQGKGAAIRNTMLKKEFDYDIYAFMDVDLSTELDALPRMIREVETGFDIVIGSRYIGGSNTQRTFKRELISRSYRFLFHLLFQTYIMDPQCGFKAFNRDVRDNLLPDIKDNGYFFDTELLIKAYSQYSIKEIPVTWNEKPDSTLNLIKDVPKFLYQLMKLKSEITRKT